MRVSVLEGNVVRRGAARGKYRTVQRCTALGGLSPHFTLTFPLLCPFKLNGHPLCVLCFEDDIIIVLPQNSEFLEG